MTHDDAVLEYLTIRVAFESLANRTDVPSPGGVASNCCDSEIDIRSDSTIQTNFVQAVGIAVATRREAKKTEVHRLANLVDTLACEKDVRDMRLDRLDPGDGGGIVGIGVWACESA